MTRFIIKEESESGEEESEVDEKELKKKTLHDNEFYFLGYFKWYWEKHGFFRAIKAFFWERFRNNLIYGVFHSMGLAIGAFFFKRLILAEHGLA